MSGEEDECSSAPSSPASAASTSDSPGLGCGTRSSAKPTLGGVGCLDVIGLACPSTTTSETWRVAHENIDGKVYESDVVPALMRAPQKAEPFIFSAAGSPAKTSASPDAAPDSPRENDPACSSSSPGSLTLFAPAGCSLRTFPDSFPQTVDEISPSFSRLWPSSGMGWPGECWTLDTSESPNGAVACSLSDVLEPVVPARFFLSSRAARGILRRAEKRGRTLPSHLRAALEAVARTTTTDKADGS